MNNELISAQGFTQGYDMSPLWGCNELRTLNHELIAEQTNYEPRTTN